MRAVKTEFPGGLERTKLVETEPERPRDGEVVVRIHAAALNPADRFLIDGQYPTGPPPPFICGRDAAGVVVRSDSAGRFAVGERVLTLQSTMTDLVRGTLCEQQCFPAESLASIPDGWSDVEAAAAPLVFQTAWQCLTDPQRPSAGDAVVVTGAGGGVGAAAVQLAVGLGANVVALTRSKEKGAKLRELGAKGVFAPDDPDLKKHVFEALGGRGADVVVETVGGPLLGTAVHLLAPHGRVGAIGVLAGVEATIPIPSLMFKRGSIQGILVSDVSPETAQTQWKEISAVLKNGKSKDRPIVDSVFPLEKFSQAFERLAGSPFGKVVVQIT